MLEPYPIYSYAMQTQSGYIQGKMLPEKMPDPDQGIPKKTMFLNIPLEDEIKYLTNIAYFHLGFWNPWGWKSTPRDFCH